MQLPSQYPQTIFFFQLVNIPIITAWLLFYFSSNIIFLYAGLCLTGLSGGLLEAPVITTGYLSQFQFKRFFHFNKFSGTNLCGGSHNSEGPRHAVRNRFILCHIRCIHCFPARIVFPMANNCFVQLCFTAVSVCFTFPGTGEPSLVDS
jgi:hypothetical protein